MVNAGCAMDQVPKLCSSSMTWSQRPAAVGGPKDLSLVDGVAISSFSIGVSSSNWGDF